MPNIFHDDAGDREQHAFFRVPWRGTEEEEDDTGGMDTFFVFFLKGFLGMVLEGGNNV